MKRSVLVASVMLTGLASFASADFVTPDTATYGWDRGSTAFSTYAEWNVFTSPSGPNMPDVGSFVGGTLPATAADFNVSDNNEASGSFITGGGNIYSFSGVVSPQIEEYVFSWVWRQNLEARSNLLVELGKLQAS